jgi:FAD/FMN-containing dehydrogenase
MDHLEADFVVNPKSEAEVIEVLRVCYAHDVPVTTRGAGTGNYGQAMPMRGGCVMHLKNMNAGQGNWPGPRDLPSRGSCSRTSTPNAKPIRARSSACSPPPGPRPRSAVSSPAARAASAPAHGGPEGPRQHHPPARRDDGGRAARAGVPGRGTARVSHAYGTNGIITEVEMPLAPAYDWVEIFVAFDDFMAAAHVRRGTGQRGRHPDQARHRLSRRPSAGLFPAREAPHVEAGHAVGLMVAPAFHGRVEDLPGTSARCAIIYRSDDNDWPKTPGAGLRIWLEPHDAARAEGRSRRSPTCRCAMAIPTTWRSFRRCARPSRRRFSSISK